MMAIFAMPQETPNISLSMASISTVLYQNLICYREFKMMAISATPLGTPNISLSMSSISTVLYQNILCFGEF